MNISQSTSSSSKDKKPIASSCPPEISRKPNTILKESSEHEKSYLEQEINKVKIGLETVNSSILYRESQKQTINGLIKYFEKATDFFKKIEIKKEVSDIINNINLKKENSLRILKCHETLLNIKKNEKEIFEKILTQYEAGYSGLNPTQDISLLWRNYCDIQKKIVLEYRTLARSFAQNYVPSFVLSLGLSDKALLKNMGQENYNQYSQYKKNIENMNRMFLHGIVVASDDYKRVLPYAGDSKNIPPLWDEDIPKPAVDLAELKKYQEQCHDNISKMLPTIDAQHERNLINFQSQKLDNKIKNFEIELQKTANDMMALLIQEEEEEKQRISLPSPSSSSHRKFTPAKKGKDIETSDIISETATSSEPSPEEYYNQKLYATWQKFFTKTDYRNGEWSGRGGISIPVQSDYFPPYMRFTLSTKEVMAHLKRRHLELVQELAKKEKKDIKDEDNFEFNISSQTPEIHNLISEIASQLSHAETVMYKSSFYKNTETGEKINSPTIMMRGKNQEGDMMFVAWGLYKEDKGDEIKLHLLSYYKDDSPNRRLLKNAMKISKFSDEVDQEIKAPVAQPLDDANLIALFEDKTSLKQDSKQKFYGMRKSKKGKKKS